MNVPDDRIVSRRFSDNVVAFSIIPVTLEDDGTPVRCVLVETDGSIASLSDTVILRVDSSPPPTCMLRGPDGRLHFCVYVVTC